MSDGAATLLQCANCSAPLAPPAHGEIDLVCHYCGGTTRIPSDAHARNDHHAAHEAREATDEEIARRRAQSERDRAKNAEEARQDEVDELERRRVQSERDKARHAKVDAEAKQKAEATSAQKKRTRLVLVLVVAVIAAIAIVIGLRFKRASFASFPLTCGSTDHLVVSKRTFDGAGAAVIASRGCTITFQDSTLKADQIVKADSADAANITITVLRSKLEARGIAIDVKGQGHVTIANNSDVYGAAGAVVGDGLFVSVQDSKVRGDDLVARCAELTSGNSSFEGKQTGLIVSIVTLRQSHVTADVGIVCESKADFKVTLDASTIDAKGVGVNATAGSLRLSNKSLVKGGTTGVYARGVILGIDDSRIEGGTTGIHAKALLQIAARASTVAGKTSAIVYEYPVKPSLDGLTLEGPYSNH